MVSKQDARSLRAKLNKIIRVLAKERDELRDLIDDAAMILESLDESTQSLEEAADALSKYF